MSKSRFARPGTVQLREFTAAEIDDAADWLDELLRGGPLYQGDVARLAEASGISQTLLALAKKRLRVVTDNVNDQNPEAIWKLWIWSLPKRQRSDMFDAGAKPPWDDDDG